MGYGCFCREREKKNTTTFKFPYKFAATAILNLICEIRNSQSKKREKKNSEPESGEIKLLAPPAFLFFSTLLNTASFLGARPTTFAFPDGDGRSKIAFVKKKKRRKEKRVEGKGGVSLSRMQDFCVRRRPPSLHLSCESRVCGSSREKSHV